MRHEALLAFVLLGLGAMPAAAEGKPATCSEAALGPKPCSAGVIRERLQSAQSELNLALSMHRLAELSYALAQQTYGQSPAKALPQQQTLQDAKAAVANSRRRVCVLNEHLLDRVHPKPGGARETCD